MDSLAYSSSTSVMSQVAYHQKYQALPKSEKLKEDPSITRKYSSYINYQYELLNCFIINPKIIIGCKHVLQYPLGLKNPQAIQRASYQKTTPKGFLSSSPRGLGMGIAAR